MTGFEGSGTELAADVDGQLMRASLQANIVGALVVFAFLLVLAPGVEEEDIVLLLAINVPVFAAYLAAALFVALKTARRRYYTVVEQWLSEERPATRAERELVLRYPLMPGVRLTATYWVLATVVFSAINLPISGSLAAVILVTIPLGGLATCAVAYLLVERVMRPVTGRALAGEPPDRPAALGVAGRLVVAWIAGTGVPVLGLAAIGIGDLLGLDLYGSDETTLASTSSLLALVALAAGLVTVFLAARSVADPIAAVRDAVQEVQGGRLDTRVAVDDGSEVGLLEAGFNRMAAGLEERERMRDLFGRHVGEHVAAEAMRSGVKLGGEEREVAALFVDIVGSTRLAAERSATEVVGLLNDFFAIVVAVTEVHGGSVNKFEGDAALCVFGAPVSRPDAVGDALAAAREMRKRLHGARSVDAGIGVSAGIAVAGNVGAEERFEYTVIGDPVNEAARLCELAKRRPERVLASEAALWRVTGDEAERWTLGEEVELRGRSGSTRLATPTG